MRIFDAIFTLFSNDIGMDLGTSTVLVYVKNKGLVFCEPSVVAIEKTSGKILAIGNEAKRMIGKTHENILAIRPLRNGVIADFESAEQMIRYFIHKAHDNRTAFLHPRIVIGIPSGITAVERRAVRESAMQAGAREVYLVDEPMAAAIGANIPVEEPVGHMIVDIGGGTTEVAVISLGGMVVAKSIGVAGDEIDIAIMNYFRKQYNLIIGEATAEETKIKIGSVYPQNEELTLEVKGRDQRSGLPRTVIVTSSEIRPAIIEAVKPIVELIKSTLEATPPELAADLVNTGITLAGGGSLIRGMDRLIADETKLFVKFADDPITCVVRGTGVILENIDKGKFGFLST